MLKFLARSQAFSGLMLLVVLANAQVVFAEETAVQSKPEGAPGSETATSATTETSATKTEEVTAEPSGKMLWKPGRVLSTTTDTEDLVATYDIDLAQKQVAAYPDSPEASFILAVALTRTSRVEEALKEVQRARRLAEGKGGPVYFDKMISSYENLLKDYPNDNEVRYGLAWAYYMKAYLLSRHSKKVAAWKAANPPAQPAANGAAAQAATPATPASATTPQKPATTSSAANSQQIANILTGKAGKNDIAAGIAQLASAFSNVSKGQTPPLDSIPHIPGALEKVDAADIPQIRKYFEQGLQKLDDLLAREPNDIWATVYRAHLKAEYTGNLEEAMTTWRAVAQKNPNNPAPYFFLGEGYLKQGNLKESINNVSKAIALRALGN